MVWLWIFNAQYGVLNYILGKLTFGWIQNIGWLSDRIGRKKIMLTCCALAAITYVPIYIGMVQFSNPDHLAQANPAQVNEPVLVILLFILAQIPGLESGKTYHYRFVAAGSGTGTTNGPDTSFTTLPFTLDTGQTTSTLAAPAIFATCRFIRPIVPAP